MTKKENYDAAAEYVEKNYSVSDNDFQNAMNIAAMKAFVAGAEWSKKKTVEEACMWLKKMMQGHLVLEVLTGEHYEADLIKDFKKEMEL